MYDASVMHKLQCNLQSEIYNSLLREISAIFDKLATLPATAKLSGDFGSVVLNCLIHSTKCDLPDIKITLYSLSSMRKTNHETYGITCLNHNEMKIQSLAKHLLVKSAPLAGEGGHCLNFAFYRLCLFSFLLANCR